MKYMRDEVVKFHVYVRDSSSYRSWIWLVETAGAKNLSNQRQKVVKNKFKKFASVNGPPGSTVLEVFHKIFWNNFIN